MQAFDDAFEEILHPTLEECRFACRTDSGPNLRGRSMIFVHGSWRLHVHHDVLDQCAYIGIVDDPDVVFICGSNYDRHVSEYLGISTNVEDDLRRRNFKSAFSIVSETLAPLFRALEEERRKC